MDPALANALTSMARPVGPASLNLSSNSAAIGQGNKSSNSAAIGQGNSASKSALEENARAAAEEFEAVFLTTMLEGMFEGLKTDGPFGGGSAEKTYRSLLVTQYAKQMSQNGGLGLSDQITRDLIALQEGAQK